jgi:hypothetical protein
MEAVASLDDEQLVRLFSVPEVIEFVLCLLFATEPSNWTASHIL